MGRNRGKRCEDDEGELILMENITIKNYRKQVFRPANFEYTPTEEVLIMRGIIQIPDETETLTVKRMVVNE